MANYLPIDFSKMVCGIIIMNGAVHDLIMSEIYTVVFICLGIILILTENISKYVMFMFLIIVTATVMLNCT